MANVFINLPATSGNGSGAWTDVSAMGAEKAIVVGGALIGTVNIEISNEAVASKGAPIKSFNGKGAANITVACKWMRATVVGYQSGGAPEVDVGANDDGTVILNLPVTAANGSGAAQNSSALPLTKTVTVGGPFKGTVIIEYSEDLGVTWSQWTIFTQPGTQTNRFAAERMRVTRTGVAGNVVPGTPLVNIGACEDTGTTPAFANVVITTSLELQGRLILDGTITPAAIAAQANDYAPPGFATAYNLRLTSTGAQTITGIAGAVDGRRIKLRNIGAAIITLANQNAGSVAANRFTFAGGYDYQLGVGGVVELQYDGTTARWARVEDSIQWVGSAGSFANPTFRFATEATGMTLFGAGTLGFAVAGGKVAQVDANLFSTVGPVGFNDGGALFLSGVITPAALAANANDYAPAGIATASELRVSGTAARNITGIDPGASPTGRRLRLVNVGAFVLTLQNQNAGSAAANRFLFSAALDYQLGVNGAIDLEYDATTARWRKVEDDTQVVATFDGVSGNPGIRFASAATGFILSGGTLYTDVAGVEVMSIDGAALSTLNLVSINNAGGEYYVGVITPAAIAGNTNDYAPAGKNTSATWRISSTAAFDLNGILAPLTNGQDVVLMNIGAFAITLKDENAGSAAANRFALVADIIMAPDASVNIRYDVTSARWRAVGI